MRMVSNIDFCKVAKRRPSFRILPYAVTVFILVLIYLPCVARATTTADDEGSANESGVKIPVSESNGGSNPQGAIQREAVSKSTDSSKIQRDGAPDDASKEPPDDVMDNLAAGALSSLFGELEGPGLHLPSVMDGMFGSALSSLDRAAGGLLSSLAEMKIDFGQSEDKKQLIARLHLPDSGNTDSNTAAPKKIHAAVLGQSHLRIKVETTTPEGFTTITTQTIALPSKVDREGMDITSKADGTVHITMRILTPDEAKKAEEHVSQGMESDRMPMMPFPRFFPALFDRSIMDSKPIDFSREIPSPMGTQACRERHGHEKLLVSKCLCDATEDPESRAVCYGNLISKSVSMARRLGKDDFATNAKHDAMECANNVSDKVACLNAVAEKIVSYLYNRNGGAKGEEKVFAERIRQAIESEDEGPSDFHTSAGSVFARMGMVLLFAIALVWIVALLYKSRNATAQTVVASASKLSSVLTQSKRSPEGKRGRPMKIGEQMKQH